MPAPLRKTVEAYRAEIARQLLRVDAVLIDDDQFNHERPTVADGSQG